MNKRIKWNEYEVALLIESFWKIEKQPECKSEIVRELSNVLRDIAVTSGISIDDKFRNINGINMQLGAIANCFFPDRPKLNCSSIFRKIALLYDEHPEKYNMILDKANEMKNKEDLALISNNDAQKNERHYLREDKENYYTWLVNCEHINEKTAKSFVKDIRNAEKYWQTSGQNNIDLFSSQYDEIVWIIDSLKKDAAFIRNNDEHNNRYIESLDLFLKYKNTCTEEIVKTLHSKIIKVLKDHFKYGINVSSPIELMRFKKYYAKDNNEEIKSNDDFLIEQIKSQGFEYSNKVFFVEEENRRSLCDNIAKEIVTCSSILFYQEYYDINEEWLNDIGVISSEMIRVILEKTDKSYIYKSKYLLGNGADGTEIKEIECAINHVWGDYTLRNVTEIKELVRYIPIDKIKYVLSTSDMFIWNSYETYSHIFSFKISKEEKSSIIAKVSETCELKGSISFDELNLEEVCAENYEISETGMCDYILSILGDGFEKNNKVFCKKGYSKDSRLAIKEFCADRKRCDFRELEEVMEAVTGKVRYSDIIEAANDVMIRIDENTFVDDATVTFDIKAIDTLLDSIIKKDGIGLKQITTFSVFPYCGATWNGFLIESYCRRFSEKYRYECITPNSRNAGAIIKKTSSLSYHELMVEALSNAPIDINEKEAFDYLISAGFILRRQYGNMKELLQQVKKKKGD